MSCEEDVSGFPGPLVLGAHGACGELSSSRLHSVLGMSLRLWRRCHEHEDMQFRILGYSSLLFLHVHILAHCGSLGSTAARMRADGTLGYQSLVLDQKIF